MQEPRQCDNVVFYEPEIQKADPVYDRRRTCLTADVGVSDVILSSDVQPLSLLPHVECFNGPGISCEEVVSDAPGPDTLSQPMPFTSRKWPTFSITQSPCSKDPFGKTQGPLCRGTMTRRSVRPGVRQRNASLDVRTIVSVGKTENYPRI